MKLRETKQDIWGGAQSFYGRYKSHKVEIHEHDDGWYVLINNVKIDKTHNSLWDNITFKTVESASEWAVNWINNYK